MNCNSSRICVREEKKKGTFKHAERELIKDWRTQSIGMRATYYVSLFASPIDGNMRTHIVIEMYIRVSRSMSRPWIDRWSDRRDAIKRNHSFDTCSTRSSRLNASSQLFFSCPMSLYSSLSVTLSFILSLPLSSNFGAVVLWSLTHFTTKFVIPTDELNYLYTLTY